MLRLISPFIKVGNECSSHPAEGRPCQELKCSALLLPTQSLAPPYLCSTQLSSLPEMLQSTGPYPTWPVLPGCGYVLLTGPPSRGCTTNGFNRLLYSFWRHPKYPFSCLQDHSMPGYYLKLLDSAIYYPVNCRRKLGQGLAISFSWRLCDLVTAN